MAPCIPSPLRAGASAPDVHDSGLSTHESTMPFSHFKLHPDLLRGLKDLGFARPTPDPGRRDSAGARGQGRARLRDDRQRQDGRVPAADPQPVDDEAARHDARADHHADARAGGADPRGPERPHRPHADQRRGRLRRRRHGPAGARLPQRRRRHRRHAGPAARSFPRALREAAAGSSSSCSTKRTGCSTWASCPTSAACCGTSRRSGRRCSSARRCRRRSRS